MTEIRASRLGGMYVKLVERGLSRQSTALAMARSGLYGCDQSFQDWSQWFAELVDFNYDVMSEVVGSPRPHFLRAAAGSKNLRLVIPMPGNHEEPVAEEVCTTLACSGQGGNTIDLRASASTDGAYILLFVDDLAGTSAGEVYGGNVEGPGGAWWISVKLIITD